jgi:hypothetical protein
MNFSDKERMNITTIKYLKRKNLGNFEHEEISVEAVLTEGEDSAAALHQLKEFVASALNGEVVAPSKITVEAPKEETKKTAPRTRTTKPAQEAAPKDTLENGQTIPPVIPQEEDKGENAGGASTVVGKVDTQNVSTLEQKESVAGAGVVGKGIVAYDSSVKEHRSRFANYLNTTYPKWTPDVKFGKEDKSAEKTKYASEVTAFSKGLHGKPFEDAKGNMLDSFKAELETFFAHAK